MKMTVLILLVVAGISATLAVCPSGWVANDGMCYKFFTRGHTWSKAESVCLGMGAELITVDTPLKSAFIKSYIEKQGLPRHWWIGGRLYEGEWLWSSELKGPSAMEYTDWGPGEPNNKGKAGCVHLNMDRGPAWNDQFCYRGYSYICERKDASAPTLNVG